MSHDTRGGGGWSAEYFVCPQRRPLSVTVYGGLRIAPSEMGPTGAHVQAGRVVDELERVEERIVLTSASGCGRC